MPILNLTLKREHFLSILHGHKREEYRDATDRMFTLLTHRQQYNYTHIRFRNGYARNAPELTIEYLSADYNEDNEQFILKLGNITHTANIPAEWRKQDDQNCRK